MFAREIKSRKRATRRSRSHRQPRTDYGSDGAMGSRAIPRFRRSLESRRRTGSVPGFLLTESEKRRPRRLSTLQASHILWMRIRAIQNRRNLFHPLSRRVPPSLKDKPLLRPHRSKDRIRPSSSGLSLGNGSSSIRKHLCSGRLRRESSLGLCSASRGNLKT